MDNILSNSIIEKMKNAFSQKEDILAVYLFGSRVRKIEKEESDLDLAIVVPNRKNISERDVIRSFQDEGIKIPFDLDLSCVDLNSAPLFLHQIIKNGTCIYVKNPLERVRLEAKIMDIYFDNQHLRNIYHHYLYKTIQDNTYGNR